MMLFAFLCGLIILTNHGDCSLRVVGNFAVVGKPTSYVGTTDRPPQAKIGKLWCGAKVLGEDTPITYGQFTRLRDGKVFEGGLTDYTTFLDLHSAPATVAGKYQCEVRTQDEQIASGNCFIYLPPILQLPSGTKYEEDIGKVAKIIAAAKRVSSGTSIRLTCPVYGYPPPYVSWTKDGEGLGSDVSYEGDDIIVEVNEKSEGTYICNADNSFPMFVDGPAMPHKLIFEQKLIVV